MARSHITSMLLIAAVATAGACRQRPVALPAATAEPPRLACWSVARSALPPDSVLTRFAGAFGSAGFTGATRPAPGQAAAGPTPIGPGGTPMLAAATASVQGDSTRYRVEVRYVPAGPGAATDTSAVKDFAVRTCSRLVQLAFPE